MHMNGLATISMHGFFSSLKKEFNVFYVFVFFVSTIFGAGYDEGNLKKYNLVYELPDVLISIQAEEIGATWENGNVWDKPLINAFFELLNTRRDFFVVLDIGAQTGCFTLLAKFFPNSQWYAFEPIQEAADVLKMHLQVNNIHNACVYQVAVSDQTGQAELKLPSDNHWGLTTLGSDPKRFLEYNTRVVECIDLDKFIDESKIGRVDFIKIDTEGWELFVLNGGKKMIQRDKPIILMEFNKINMQQCQVNPGDVIATIKELGYEWRMVSSEDLLCTPRI